MKHFITLLILMTTNQIHTVEGEVYIGDINNDGIVDKLESDDLSNYGSGGGKYLLTLSSTGKSTKHVIEGNGLFRAEVPPQESQESWVRIWSYWHMSAVSGYLTCVYLSNGQATNEKILISTGDGGTELGNAVYNTVLQKDHLLQFTKIDNYIVPVELR